MTETAEGEEWVFTADQLRLHTASRADNLKEEEEEAYRAKTCDLIKLLGMEKLKMSRQSVWVAAIIAHRFFTVESFRKRDRLVVAGVSLWIAGKVEDKQRSLTEIVGHYLATRHRLTELPNPDSDLMKKTKALFVDYERLIMHSMGFHLYLDISAGKLFVERAHMIRANAPPGSVPDRFIQVASNFLNDCFFRTSLPVRCQVNFIPSIALYITIMFFGLPEPSSKPNSDQRPPPPPPPTGEPPAPPPPPQGDNTKNFKTWLEALGIQATVEHYALLRRLVDLYRRSPGDRYRHLLTRFDAEYATVAGKEKGRAEGGGGQEASAKEAK